MATFLDQVISVVLRESAENKTLTDSLSQKVENLNVRMQQMSIQIARLQDIETAFENLKTDNSVQTIALLRADNDSALTSMTTDISQQQDSQRLTSLKLIQNLTTLVDKLEARTDA